MGIDPADGNDLRRRKRQLTITAAAKWALCPVWIVTYGLSGSRTAALVPLAYMVLSAMSIVFFAQDKRFDPFRRRQVLLIFLLPFALQWSLGGFIPASCVALWSLLAPVTCLFFGSGREAVRWFAAYIGLLALSALADSVLARFAAPVPVAVVRLFFVLNVTSVSALTFIAVYTYQIVVDSQASELALVYAKLRTEVNRAQEVQQVLVPNQLQRFENYFVEAVYLPAREVGGDFFQVIPSSDGSLVAVIGDVSGKGIPAAMVVALVVGAVRTATQFTTSPAALLAILNQRLTGRMQSGFATCLIARISSLGEVAIANAGHVHPYLNGREIELEPHMPLGITHVHSYREERRQLEPGDLLTFLSDGVVEARHASGQLFGFDRTEAISVQPAPAIVDAAKAVGQEDDITVLTVRFAPACPAGSRDS